MYQQNGIQSYQKTNVITADSGKLVIMCYEGVIDSLILAKQKYEEKDYEEKCKHIVKAKRIVDELLCSLDFEKGGVIAKNLKSLYIYMDQRIIYADLNKDMRAFDEVIRMLRELLTAWQEAVAQPVSDVQPQTNNYNTGRMQAAGNYT